MLRLKWTNQTNNTFYVYVGSAKLSVFFEQENWHWRREDNVPLEFFDGGIRPTLFEAQAAAEESLLCNCAESEARSCGYHQIEPAQPAAVGEQPCCVYFVGADSTGKSELCRYVARAYGMRKVGESARAMLDEEGLTLPKLRARAADADAYQRLVFERQLEREAQVARPYVADRGLDNLAYASENGRCVRELAERPEVRAYVERQRGDVVFLVRPQRELRSEDGVRALPSWEVQQRIDAKIELLLQLWDIQPVLIAEASSARREELIDWALQAKGFRKR